MKQSPRITVCVATKNRTDMLHQLLWSLIRQEYKEWDLVIVDDSDVPVDWNNCGVYPRLFMEINRTGHRVKFVSGPRAGKIGLAYQFGFLQRFPDNPLFFRVDDDSFLEPNYFKQLVPSLKNGTAAAGGLFLHPGGEIEEWGPGDDRLKHGTIQHLSDQCNIQWFKHRAGNLIEVEHLTANILFSVEWLDRIGGFDSRYNQHRDETQATWRLNVEGGKLYVHPGAVAWHLRGVNGGARGAHPNVYLEDHRFFMIQRRTMKPGLRIDLGNALGDGIMYTPMLAEMRKQNPGRNISVWAQWGEAVLTGNPDVDEVCKHPNEGHRTQFITGAVYEWATQNQWKGHYIDAACKMFALPEPEDKRPRLYLDDKKPADLPGAKYVVVAPYSKAQTFDFFGPADNKNWTLGRWTELVSWLSKGGCHIVQTRGSADETEIPGVDETWTGRPLCEVFHLIKNADLVISVDTFAHHAAVALDVPAVVLWGRSKPEQFGYDLPTVRNIRGECPGGIVDKQIVGQDGKPVAVKIQQERPCIDGNQWAMDQRKCPIGGHPCMNEITVEQVWEAAKELLSADDAEAHVDCDTTWEVVASESADVLAVAGGVA